MTDKKGSLLPRDYPEPTPGHVDSNPEDARRLRVQAAYEQTYARHQRKMRRKRLIAAGAATAVFAAGDGVYHLAKDSLKENARYQSAHKVLGEGSPADPNNAPDTKYSHRLDANGNPIVPTQAPTTQITAYPENKIGDLPTMPEIVQPGDSGLDQLIERADPNASLSLVAELRDYVTPHVTPTTILHAGETYQIPVVPGADKMPPQSPQPTQQ